MKKDGHFAVMFMEWLPFEDEIAKKSEELVLKYNPNWQGANYTRDDIISTEWVKDIMVVEDYITFDSMVNFSREGWHGRIKACRGIGASSLSDSEIAEWQKEHTEFLNTVPEIFNILHHCTIIKLRKK